MNVLKWGIPLNEELFLLQLRSELIDLDIAEVSTIVAEYEALFQDASENGLTDEEVIQQLGHPQTIAAGYKHEQLGHSREKHKPVQTKKSSNIWTIIGFVFMSLVFIIPLYLSVFFTMLTLVILNIVLVLWPVVVFVGYAFLQADLFEVFFVILLSGIGFIILPFLPKVVWSFIKLAIRYVQYSKKIFRGSMR